MTPTYPIVPPRPSVPVPFAAGTVKVPAGAPMSLLDLIHQQINRDVPGTSTQLTISADPCNQTPVYLGAFMGNPLQQDESEPSNAGRPGPLSATNYGQMLSPMGEPIEYRSSYPGTQSPIGVLQVFSEAAAKIHIVVVE
jgi:hypothetical protein